MIQAKAATSSYVHGGILFTLADPGLINVSNVENRWSK